MDSGNVAWMLTASALVLFMTPGLAFFYGGLVRGKNAVSTIMYSFAAMGVVSVVWVLWGYSLAFGAGGASGSGGLIIWPLFGSTIQILAGRTLLVITVMLIKMGRPARYTMVPMIFVLFTSSWAALIKLREFYAAGNWLLVTIDLIVVVTTFMVILEAASVISKEERKARASSTE